MATIEKMQIRGIRSFSPNRDETIEFYSPITMIVGANGCGKTSIIECLKYACCGVLPPNAKSGHTFLNDPSMTGSTDVKAHIKLRFQNRRGYPCVAVRSLQLTKKKTKLEFKALDAVLRTTTDRGEKVSTSMKCTEIDRQIPDLIGVSAAVMDSVIFCHQEESNWPMQEGAVLKKKFDDIFDSSRYTKALEAVQKTRKELASRAKDLKGLLLESNAHLLSANSTKEELRGCEEQLEAGRGEVQASEEKLERNSERLRVVKEKLKGVEDIERKGEQLRGRLQELETRAREKEQGLERLYDPSSHPDEALLSLLSNFEAQTTSKNKELQEMRMTLESTEKTLGTLRNQSVSLASMRSSALSLRDQLSSLRSSHFQICSEAALKLGFPSPRPGSPPSSLQTHSNPSPNSSPRDPSSEGWTSSQARQFLSLLQQKIREGQEERTSRSSQSRELVGLAERKQLEAQGKLQKLNADLQSLQRQGEGVNEEIRKLRAELTSNGNSAGGSGRREVANAERDLEEAVRALREGQASLSSKVETLKTQIKETQEKVRELTEGLRGEEALAREMTASRTELAVLSRSEESLGEDWSEMRRDAASSLYRIFDLLSSEPSLSTASLSYSDRAELGGNVIPQGLAPRFQSLGLPTLNDLIGELGSGSSWDGSKRLQELRSLGQTLRQGSTDAEGESTRIAGEISGIQALLKQEEHKSQQFSSSGSTGAGLASIQSRAQSFVDQMNDVLASPLFAAFDFDFGFQNSSGASGNVIDRDAPLSSLVSMASQVVRETMELESVVKAGKRYARVLKRERKKAQKCPCCEQSLSASQVQTFESNVERLMFSFNSPSTATGDGKSGSGFKLDAEACETASVKCREVLDGLRALESESAPLILHLQQAQASLKKVDELRLTLQRLKDQEIDIKSMATESRKISERFSSVLRELEDLCTRATGIQRKKQENEERRSRLIGPSAFSSGSNRSLEDLELAIDDKKGEIELLTARKEKLVAEEAKHSARIQQLNQHKLERDKHLSEVRLKSVRGEDIEKNLKTLESKASNIEAERRRLTGERRGFEEEVEQAQAELRVLKQKLQALEEQAHQWVTQGSMAQESVGRGVEQLDQLERRVGEGVSGPGFKGVSLTISEIESAVQENEREILEKEESIRTLSPKIQSTSSQLNSQDRVRRNVKDNIDLRALRREIEEATVQSEKIERDLGAGAGGRVSDLRREQQRAEQERQKLCSERDHLRGWLDALGSQAAAHRAKLSLAPLLGAETRQRERNIEFETTEMAVRDLEAYFQALDSALQAFHIEKIREVNKLIRDLWGLTYRGGDIEGLEIESGVDPTDSTPGPRGSRSYQYRVVMLKGAGEAERGVSLEMRGRCSAGQRVLASLIIRLALAETFCMHTGILALDEPTTNLDEPNRAGLAQALARLVASRSSSQAHFQLICITHDEEFVHLLNQELGHCADFAPPTHYFRICRTQEDGTEVEEGEAERDRRARREGGQFFSHIERIPWALLR